MDRIDAEIVRALQNEGRLSNKELAGRVGLAPSSCLERVRRLEQQGVLRGYHADVDPAQVGVSLEALVTVQLVRHARDSFAHFEEYVLGLDEVVHVFQVGGAHDFLIHVVVPDSDHLRSLVMDRLATRTEVARMETMLIFEHQRKPALPIFTENK